MCGVVVIVSWKKLCRLGVLSSIVLVAGRSWVSIHVDILAEVGGGASSRALFKCTSLSISVSGAT